MGNILVESKKHGTIQEFTPEQWANLKATGHASAWKVLSAEGLLPAKETIKPVSFNTIERFGDEETHLDVEFTVDYRKLLDEAGVKYNPRIKDPAKFKALWEKFKSNDDFSA